MTDELQLDNREAYEIADNFAQASARILDFRIANRNSLSDDEVLNLEKYEDNLDHLVVLFRGYGIQLIGDDAQQAVSDLRFAIDRGKNAIEKVKKIKKTIKIAGALVDLAVATMTRNPEGVIAAAKSVRSAVNGKGK
jgi:hypothetical protein